MNRNNFSIDILNCARLCFRARIKTRIFVAPRKRLIRAAWLRPGVTSSLEPQECKEAIQKNL